MFDRLRFSVLKYMALSPSHLQHAARVPLETTRAIRIGTATHSQVLGGNVVVFDGTRRGKAWEAFKAEHAGSEIVSADEYAVAHAATMAVLRDPVAGPLFVLRGADEHRIDWDFHGEPFRSTPDRVFRSESEGITTLVELKTARTAEPGAFLRDAQRRHYHAQVAVYREALRQTGTHIDRVVIVAVETAAPFAVTVFEVSESTLDLGWRTACGWMERYKVHKAANEWPSYSQAPVPWDIQPEVELDFGDEEEGEEQ